ncbi:MAG: rod shape-determining protein MreD, partial [Alphaproteobacteria bacterium]|nr:rod shape-determining protein MreD [Alphaproteobacteria bacterium]
MGGLLHLIGVAIRSAIPAVLGFLLATLASVPTGIEHLGSVMPALALIAVYYWTVQRPDLMAPAAAFLIGLWKDILLGGPLGLMAVLLLLARTFVVNQRQFVAGQAFLVGWMGFILLSAGVA